MRIVPAISQRSTISPPVSSLPSSPGRSPSMRTENKTKSGTSMATPPTLLPVFLLFLAASSCDSAALFFPFNSSALSLPINSSYLLRSPPPDLLPRPPSFLREVLRALSAKERWDPETEARVSDLYGRGARAGVAHRYEFNVRIGRRALILKFYDEAVSWRKVETAAVKFGSDLVAGEAVANLRPAVRGLELVGPLELRVGSEGGDDDRISLRLCTLNVTHNGLRRIFVGNGITVKIVGAKRVSLSHPYDIGLSLNGSLAAHVKDHNTFWNIGYSTCAPLLSVHVVGSASVLAYTSGNYADNIVAAFTAYDTLELLPRKCYCSGRVKQRSSCSFCSIKSRLGQFDKFIRGLLGNSIFQKTPVRFIKANITSVTLIKFRLQLEIDVTKNNSRLDKIPAWKQKPKVDQIWLEVTARLEGKRRLKPVLVRKLKRPYIIADSISVSSLLLNVSFTKLPSFVVPPEALTLDVKW